MMSTTEIRAISTSINGRSYAKAETVILMHKLAAKQVYAKSGILLEAITINSTVSTANFNRINVLDLCMSSYCRLE